MKWILFCLAFILPFFIIPSPAFAVSTSADITTFTTNTLQIITAIASAAAVLFLVKGGYFYITSNGKPDGLENAKKTIRNAVLGLVLVLGAGLLVSLFQGALTNSANNTNTTAIALTPISAVTPSDGLTQVLIDAVNGFMQNIVESATKPIVDGIFGFLATTPTLLNNSVVFNFWLVILGITDSLFVLVVALLGLHFMSASTLGFEEVELKQLLPRIGLAFLGANTSLFLADYVIVTCNTLVTAVINSTGGLAHAWVLNAVNLDGLLNKTTPLITLVFLIIFLIVAIVLLLMYITRLITISLAGVLSPFIFLLWIIPRFSDFAEIAVKGYLVTVFTVFIHVVIIQLASSFLTIPGNTNNTLLSIAIGIGLFLTLLKTPSFLMQLVFYNTGRGMMRKIGGQIMNVMTTDRSSESSSVAQGRSDVRTPRRVVRA
jgi:hypothetical protein